MEACAESPVKKALALITELEGRLAAFERERSEPIAVVGLGCRFPGNVNTPEDFWDMLKQGRSALTPVPAQRFEQQRLYDPDPAAVGKLYVRNGYFLDAIDRFDAPFFGISPREAEQMDPQQRLLLEVAWEALERAAQPWSRLRDSKTGVFVGIANYDYAQMIFSRRDYAKIDSFSGTGNSFSFLTGRLSYLLGLQGPSVAIDTACSSSLVAIHLACASLRSGESDCALAGGVQIVASPIPQLFLCRSQALSADGTCKAFAAGADGYGRGEGCGIVVLKRLSDALRERDQIWGVIRTSAVNHDGASSGLTVPNPRAQVRVLQTALRSAAIAPESIAYVEAHGVGTPIGDPIEMRSIAGVLGVNRPPTRPIYVGSAKTNIGHLEGAAGIAGFIKTLLAVRYGEIPRNLHFDARSSQIDWASMNVAVPTAHLPWPDPQLPRRGAVNAFGLSGTNAHVVIESAPPVAAASAAASVADSEGPYILALSAKSPQALNALSARYREFLPSHPDVSLADVCYSAATGRAHSSQRAALVASDRAGIVGALDALLASRPAAGTHSGRVPNGITPRAAFLYTGQGAQYAGMGRALYAAYPAFRRVIDRCDARLRDPALLGQSIRELMLDTASDDPYRSTLLAQTALFSFEMALTELWRSWGISPDVLLGHSLGEYAAACAAGVFDLEDGLRLLVARGKLVASLTQEGRMATVFASEATLLPHLQPFAGLVGIAAINGPEIVVLSGVATAMNELLPRLSAAGVRTVPLAIAQAFHSPLVEPILAEFRRAAEQVRFSNPHTTLLSNLSDDGLPDPLVATPEYWVRHLRHTVRFYDCLRQLHREKFEIFVEIGPEPVLLAFDQCLPESVGAPAEADVLWLPSVRRELPERQQMLESLGALYSRGFDVDWSGVYAGEERKRVAAPTYPFEDRRYWAIEEASDEPREPLATSSASGVAALLENQDVAALLRLVEARQPLSSEVRASVEAALRVLAEQHRALTAPSRLEHATYGIDWQQRPLPASAATDNVGQGPWILFAEPGEAREQIAAQLERRGAICIFVSEGADFRRSSERSFTVRSAEPADLCRLFAELEVEFGSTLLGGALVLWPEAGARAEHGLEQCEAVALRLSGLLLHVLQATHDLSWAREATLWALTRGAVCVGRESASELMPFGAPLWGAAKVAALEYPRLWGGIIDSVSPPSMAEEAAQIVAEIASRSGEDQVALRGGARLVPRLVKTRLSDDTYRFAEDAHYVITGGLGFLGLAIADWIVAQGVRHLTLVSRREPDDAVRARIRGLEAAGASVEHVRADVTDSEAMRALFDRRELPVRGIFHLAGSAGFVETAKLPFDRFLALVAPKISGTRIVHEAAQGQPLDFFFCSSSLSSIWGYKGGFHYAAANAFLDSFMSYRRASGQPGLAVNIGPCSGGGVAEPQFLEMLEKVGVVPITPDLVTDALSHLLATLEPTMVAKMNWPIFTELYEAQRPSPFLSEMRAHAELAEAGVGQGQSEVLRELLAAPRSQRRELLTRALQREVVDVLRLPAGDEPDPRLGFFSMGMNSIMVMELRARVQRTLKVDLAATLVFNKPTIDELTEHLLVTLPGLGEEVASSEPVRAVPDLVALAPVPTETLDELSEDELERMLDRTLDALPGANANHSSSAELEAAAGRS